MIQRYVRRAIALWEQWRFDKTRSDRARSLRTAVPALAVLDKQRAEIARRHKPGGPAIDKQKQRVMTERLRLELAGRA